MWRQLALLCNGDWSSESSLCCSRVRLQHVFSLRFLIFEKRNEPCQKIKRAALQCSFGGSSMAHRKERESLDSPGQSLHANSNNHLQVLR